MENKITIFIERMKKVGVDVVLKANYPWIYIDTINGKRVVETFMANHGFTVGYLSIRQDGEFVFSDIKETFKLIRKYI
jgi:hypothetical protein